ERTLAARADRDFRALARKAHRRGAPDALARSGDERDFPFQPQVHSVSPPLLLLRPVDVVVEFRVEAQDVERKHAVRAQLPQLARIALLDRLLLFVRQLVAAERAREIALRALANLVVHLEIEEKTVQMITAHTVSARVLSFEL